MSWTRKVSTGNVARSALISALAIVIGACSPIASSPRARDVAAATRVPSAASETGFPALVDVTEYRGDTARTGVYPGPGPVQPAELVWSRDADGPINFNPLLADGMLLFGTVGGHFYALDARTGELAWDFAGSAERLGEVVGSGSVSDGIVVFSTDDGILHALDAASGEELWSAPGSGGGVSDIVDGVVYTAGTDRQVHGHDLRTGDLRWAWMAPDHVNGVTVDGGVAYASVLDGRLYALSIADRQELWHHQTIGQEAGLAVVGPKIVFINALETQSPEPAGDIYALDRDTGELLWSFRGPSGHQVSLGAIGDGAFYSGTVRDGIWAFAHDAGGRATAQIVWHTEVDGSVWKNAALVDDVLYFPQSDPGAVLAVRASDGTVLWRIPLEGAAQAPVVSGGLLFIADDSGHISAYAESPVRTAIGKTASGPLSGAEPSASAAAHNPFAVVPAADWETTTIAVPLDLDLGPDGFLYVLDTKPSVTVLDPATGKPVRSWGRQGTGEGEFDFTRPDENAGIGALAVGTDGRVYVGDGANHRIQVFESDGRFLRQFGTFGIGEGQFSRIFHIAVGHDGSVYAVDHDLHYLSRFDATGEFMWRIGGPQALDPDLRGIIQNVVVAPDGNLWLNTEETVQILVIDPADGTVIRKWGGPEEQAGVAAGIATFDSTGNIYLFTGNALQAFDANENFLGGIYGSSSDMVKTPVWGDLFYPAPVFARDGYGYSFGKHGLLRLQVTLPPA